MVKQRFDTLTIQIQRVVPSPADSWVSRRRDAGDVGVEGNDIAQFSEWGLCVANAGDGNVRGPGGIWWGTKRGDLIEADSKCGGSSAASRL